MKSPQRSWLDIGNIELKINYSLSCNFQVVRDQSCQSREMLFIELEPIIINLFDIVSKDLINDSHGKNRFKMGLFVGVELVLPIKMNGQVWHFHQGVFTVPVLALKLLSIFTLDDNLAGQGKVSVEPGAPKTASVGHHVDLIIPKSV